MCPFCGDSCHGAISDCNQNPSHYTSAECDCRQLPTGLQAVALSPGEYFAIRYKYPGFVYPVPDQKPWPVDAESILGGSGPSKHL